MMTIRHAATALALLVLVSSARFAPVSAPAQDADEASLGACEVDIRPSTTPVVVVGTEAPSYQETASGGGGTGSGVVTWTFDNTVWPEGSEGVAVKIGDYDGAAGIRLDPLGHTIVTIKIDTSTMTGTLHIDNGLEPPHNILDEEAHVEGTFDPFATDVLVVEEEVGGETEETGRTRIKASAYGLSTGFTLTEL